MPTQALFVDLENVWARNLDLTRLVDSLSKRGDLVLRRAFGTSVLLDGIKERLDEAGVERVYYQKNPLSHNQADIELIVDAMEVALLRPEIDTFIIASGDSDFLPLVRKLQDYKRQVVVVGRPATMSSNLKRTCNQFISLQSFVSPSNASTTEGVPLKCLNCLYWANQINLECDAQLEAEGHRVSRNERRSYLRLVSTLHMLYPTFSPRSYGFPKNSGIRKILQAIEHEGHGELSRCQESREILFEFNDSFPVPSDPRNRPVNYDKVLSVCLQRERTNWRKQLVGDMTSEAQSASSRAHCEAVS